LLSAVDKFIVEQAPWKLVKSTEEAGQRRLDSTLYTAAESVRVAAILLAAVLPESTAKIWAQLGMAEPLDAQRIDRLAWGGLPESQAIGETAAVFPRIDAQPALARMSELEDQEDLRQGLLTGKTKAAPASPPSPPVSDTIDIGDFAKVDLRVGQVLEAGQVKGADKLLHLKIDIGEGKPRSIVAGIAAAYQPGQLIGRKVVIVANLQPRKLRGIESQGMIVAASLEGGSPVLAGFLEDVPIGARLK
jgi:methionyl-tRNA synthetase